jgi:hypothetical protein
MDWIHLAQGNFFTSSMIMMIPGRGKIFLSTTASAPVLGPTERLIKEYQGFFPWG